MKVSLERAVELARDAGLDASPRVHSNAVHVKYMLGNNEMSMGLRLPLNETIEDVSAILDMMRGITSKPYLREQADRFIELLRAEEARLSKE